MIVFENIPMPPSQNQAYPSNRFGRRFKSKELKNWEAEFKRWGLLNLEQVSKARMEFHTLKPGFYIWIGAEFHFRYAKVLTKEGRPKKNDTSNRIKHLHDSIANLIWVDDSMFWNGMFAKHVSKTETDYCTVLLEWRYGNWGKEHLFSH